MKFMIPVWDYDISATQKLVMLKLGDNASDDGFCWPSIPHIAAKCGLTDRSVQRVLKFLEDNGCVIRRIRLGHSTYFTLTDPSQWRIPLSKTNKISIAKASKAKQVVTQSHPATVSPRGDTESPRGVTQSHPEPTIGTRQETKALVGYVNNVDKFKVNKPIEYFLNDDDRDKLRQTAPGWDAYALFKLYDDWSAGKESPRNQKAAFFGWLKKFTKSKPPGGSLFESEERNSYG